ncbi:MAG: hypothetical protein ACTHKY_10040 [Ginsengibacter sp.]
MNNKQRNNPGLYFISSAIFISLQTSLPTWFVSTAAMVRVITNHSRVFTSHSRCQQTNK